MSTSTASPGAGLVIDKHELELNDRHDMEIHQFDWAGTPVLVIDRLYRRPDYVRRLALSLDFYRTAGFYPGFFAFVSLSQEPLLNLVNECLFPRLGRELAIHPFYQELTFAVVTKHASELVPAQRIPHYDNFCDVAGVVYLNPPAQCIGGTSFWRHRATMLEMAPQVGDPAVAALAPLFGARDENELLQFCLQQGLPDPPLTVVANSRNPDPNPDIVREKSTVTKTLENSPLVSPLGFPNASTPFWELRKVVPMQYNRLIVYSARLFHTLHVAGDEFGESIDTRRLTQNLYFKWRVESTISPQDVGTGGNR